MSYQPDWQDVRTTALAISTKNVWRTLPEHDVDDLMQTAYIKFEQCREKFTKDTASEFRNFFSFSFSNTVKTMALARTTRNTSSLSVWSDDEHTEWDIAIECHSFAELDIALAIEETPSEVKRLLSERNYFGGDSKLRKYKGQPLNDWLCKLINADPKKLDLSSMVIELYNSITNGDEICIA